MEIELGKIIEAGKEKEKFYRQRRGGNKKIKCRRDFYRTFRPSKKIHREYKGKRRKS